MNIPELQHTLQAITAAEYTLAEAENKDQIIETCLAQRGSSDPELPDGLTYPVLARWSTHGVLSDEHNRALLWRLSDGEHLTNGLGEAGGEYQPFPQAYFREINTKHFLRSLYHRVRKRQTDDGLLDAAAGVVDQVGRF